MKHRPAGFALPLVLLFVALIAGLLMSSAAYSMIGAKQRNTTETTSTMALFAAESLLAKIDGQLKDSPLYQAGLTTSSALQQLKTWNLDSMTLDNAATATIEVTNVSMTSTSPVIGRITLKSKGAASGAVKYVLKDYVFSPVGNAAIGAGGALISHPAVVLKGSPTINGVNGATSTGIAYDPDSTAQISLNQALKLTNVQYTASQTITIADPRNTTTPTARIDPPPSYIDIGNPASTTGHQRFKVTAKGTSTLTLLPINSGSGTTYSVDYTKGTAVGSIPIAVTAKITPTTDTIQQLPVTNTKWFTVGKKIYVNYITTSGSTGTAVGSVTALDAATSKITVSFTGCSGCSGFPSGVTVSEGTPIRQDVTGVDSASSVDTKGNASVTAIQNDASILNPFGTPTATCPSGDLMFCSIFGIDRDLFKALNPPKNLSDLSNLSGLTVINGGITPNGNKGICGSGVLVIFGDVTINTSNCKSNYQFYGLIYVIGNLTTSGNLTVAGSVMTEGTIEQPATAINGSGSKGDRIEYSLMALNNAGDVCCSYTTKAQSGTWRQQ